MAITCSVTGLLPDAEVRDLDPAPGWYKEYSPCLQVAEGIRMPHTWIPRGHGSSGTRRSHAGSTPGTIRDLTCNLTHSCLPSAYMLRKVRKRFFLGIWSLL